MRPRETSIKYPFSKKRVLFSCVLVATTIGFTFYALTDPFSIFLFFVYTLLLTAIFLVLKLHLYSTEAEKLESPHFEKKYASQEKNTLKRQITVLLILLIFALFLPFSLLLFLNPFTWFMSITGFIAGINIPEIILYIYAQRITSHKNSNKRL